MEGSMGGDEEVSTKPTSISLAAEAPSQGQEAPSTLDESKESDEHLNTAATNMAGEPVVEVGLENAEDRKVEPAKVEEH